MKKLTMFLAAALLATGIVAGYLWLQLHESRRQNAALQASRHTGTSARHGTGAQQFTPAEPHVLPAPQGDDAGSPAAAFLVAPEAPPEDPRQRAAQRPDAALIEGARQVFSSQQGRDMVQPAVRGMVQQRLKGVGEALRLTEAEEEKLVDTLTRQQMDLSAASMDLLAGNDLDAGSRQQIERRTLEVQRASEAELIAMLGSKYPQLREFESVQAVRQQVSQLQAALGTSGGEISEAQAAQLVAALAAEQKQILQDASANPVPAGRSREEALDLQIQRTVDGNRRLIDTASRYLNSQQLDGYRRMLEQQEQMLRSVLGRAGSGK